MLKLSVLFIVQIIVKAYNDQEYVTFDSCKMAQKCKYETKEEMLDHYSRGSESSCSGEFFDENFYWRTQFFKALQSHRVSRLFCTSGNAGDNR